MKILITGSTGFVGRNWLQYCKNKMLDFSNKVFSRKDLLGRDEVFEEYFTKIDVVLHLAGKAHDSKSLTNPDEYYEVNTNLTKTVFDRFLVSDAKVFITLSSTKAVADEAEEPLSEEQIPNPITHYGKSKLLAEQYILSKLVPEGKRVYILRPCMIHGPGNKGNLNLLYQFVSKGAPWPLGAFENQRSFCSIENLLFIFKELIMREDIPSGIYNVSDDDSLSLNEVISILAESQNRDPNILRIPRMLISIAAKIGNILKLPLNEERLKKLTYSYVVSNQKIKSAICKPLQVSSREGLLKTFKSFN